VLGPDGEPREGVVVYAYQTDATGVYAPPGRPPRLRAFMKTGRDGRFAYDTIRPGSYPGTRNPAHVHHQLWGGGYPPQWANDLLFDDDPLVPAAERRRSDALGPFGFVRRVEEHPLHGRLVKLRLRLEPTGGRFEAGTRHGLDACRHAGAPR
jgi:protocatechuate 3,4-dioxygenase beta subunit